MKHNARKLLALLLCLAMCLSLLPTLAVSAADEPIRVACIGDSITYGHDPATNGATQIKNNWPTVLGQLLGDGYDVRNFGQNGITLLHTGGTPVFTIDRYKQSLAFEPDIVIIMLGTNDSPPESGWNKGDQFRADMKELVESYRSLDSKPTVYIATCATAFGSNMFGLSASSIHNNIVPLQKELAEELGCPLLDVHEATADLGDCFKRDGIHPDEAGHKAMAEYIYSVLSSDEPDVPDEPSEPISTVPIYEDTSYSFEERAADLIARMTLQQKASQLVEGAAAIPASQLGGGALHTTATKGLARYSWWAEALHGLLRDNMNPQSEGTKDNVSYAQSLTMASTWNPELYYEGATAIADECRERSITNELGNALNINFYSPTVNMQRDPRWGRNEESYSEDVYLTSVMGTQFVLGMEGKDQDGNMLDPNGYYKTHTTIKHYTANNTEAIRTNGGATSDIRALREYYTAPYNKVIRNADASSVMTAYSSFNGEPCSYSSYLMDTLLRQTFGFSGYITSDCDSAKTISNLNYTNPRTGSKLTAVEQMAGALAHGEDLECNSGISANVGDYNALASSMVSSGVQTDKGTFTENSIDVSAHRLMTARIATGELDENNPYTIAANERKAAQKAAGGNNYTQERIDIVDREVEEGVVMLKNNGTLPLSIPATGEYKMVIVGSWQTDMYLGLYSSEQRHSEDEKWRINIQEGITEAVRNVNPNATLTYITSNSLTDANKTAISEADAVVVVAGTGNSYSAEGRDRSSIVLPNSQDTLISTVGKLNPNTIAVMETCGPVQVTKFENDVGAILWSSYGGIRKGIGFGKIITGAVNPSGKVTATWYQNDSDIPGIRDYNMYATNGSNGRTYMYYVGANKPSYVFGYGLSYTTFAYSNLKIDKTAYDANDTVKVTFDVKNTGSVEGKEVTELYIAQPDAPAELLRPIKRLEGFEKVNLKPGETKTISMEVKIPDLAFYSEGKDCYEVDTGKYQVQVGGDSELAANLTKDFTVSGEMDVYPELLTVKANQEGDEALGIEERIIFDRGAIVNPQLTVAMNNEKLYGYIIKEQTSVIKSLKSTELPEGMKFTYESNRPSVAKVENGVIKTVGPGVATITVTGELDGHTVTADFVVYVMVNVKADTITVDGEPLAKFNPDKYSYKMTLDSKAHVPQIDATVKEGLTVKVTQAKSVPGIATVTVTEPESKVSQDYTIEFKVKSTGGGSTTIDFANPADESKFEVINQKNAAIKEGDGLLLTATRPAFETCNGQNSGDNATNPEDVIAVPVSGDWTATLEFDFSTAGAANGYYQFFGFYASAGEDYQNLAGIRGGDGAMQNFTRIDGVIDADNNNSSPGLAANGTYWYRIVKEGDTYICSRSSDGDEFADMFTYEATGIDADQILIDAYTGMTEGYQFNLKSLEIEGVGGAGLPDIDFTAPSDADKFDVINQSTAEIVDGEGVTLVATRPAFETCNGQNSGDNATNPVDVIAVPVSGDWIATLEFDFSTGSSANGYYQFFGFYASEGEDYQNLAGIRGGDGAMQNFTRIDGVIDADNNNSEPGLASNGTYWYQIAKEGTTYICSRSSDGDEFTQMFTYEDTGIEADQILIDAYTGMTEGYTFTLKSLTFEGGGEVVEKEKPEIAGITVDGVDCGFDPSVKIYNFEVAKDSAKAPVIAATAGNKSTKVEIKQLDGPFGTAYVTGTVDNKSVTYSLSFNYGPQDDYFADGDMSDDWTILHEVKDATADRPYTYYRFEEGTGLVLPTQKGSIYMAKQADPKGPWTNVFTMPAQGNWEVVIKSFYPQLPKDIYQQTQVFAWQDEDHYIRINCQYNAQQNLRVEPANEVGSGTFNILDVTYAKANDDGTATLYYKINKNGTTYTVSYSTDCKNWVAGGSVSGLDYVDPKIGIFCTQDDGNDNWIELAFEYVAVTSLNGVEQRNGPEVLAWAAQQAADYMAAGLPASTCDDLAVKAPHGYTVEFVSSDEAVIGADGKVKQAETAKAVQVAVKVTEGDVIATSEAVTINVPGTKPGECPHDYEKVVTAPTCTEPGFTTYTCKLCGDSYKADEAAALGHDYVDGKCTRCGAEQPVEPKECPSAKYTDAPAKDNWAHEGIDFCIAEGYMNGMNETIFKPQGTVTRAQLVTIIYRVAGSPAVEFKGVFEDVKDSKFYSKAVEWAAAEGVVTGKTETKFAPDEAITREQIAAILYRYEGSPEIEADLAEFPDAADASNYAKKALSWAVKEGLINGIKSNGVTTLSPKANATRAQIATIIMRFLEGSYKCGE